MRWSRANLEEKQEPRAATSASAERREEGIWHDVTRKGLTEAAIEKRTLAPPASAIGGIADIQCPLLYRGFGQDPFWLRHATFLLHAVLHWLMLPHGALASLRGWRMTTS